MNKTAKKNLAFQNDTSSIKITINNKLRNEDVYDTGWPSKRGEVQPIMALN